jgi:hypothetical protein
MEKIKILGVTKNEFESHYTFEKKEEFMPFLERFLIEIGFEKRVAGGFTHDPENEAEEDSLPYYALEDLEDSVRSVKNDEYSVDIFIGHKKIILILRYDDKQQEVSDKIFKFAEFDE